VSLGIWNEHFVPNIKTPQPVVHCIGLVGIRMLVRGHDLQWLTIEDIFELYCSHDRSELDLKIIKREKMLQKLKRVHFVGVRHCRFLTVRKELVKILFAEPCSLHGRSVCGRLPQKRATTLERLFQRHFHVRIGLALLVVCVEDRERLRCTAQRRQAKRAGTVYSRLQLRRKEANNVESTFDDPFWR